MSEHEIVDLVLSVSTKQDALWAIFFSVHMAIFGGIIYVDRPLKRTEKLFAIIAYLVFALMNFAALRAGQRMLSALRADLMTLAATQETPSQTASLFEESNRLLAFQEPITVSIHVVAALLVIGAILFDRERASTTPNDELR